MVTTQASENVADAVTRRLREPLPQTPDSSGTQLACVANLQFITIPMRIFPESHDFTEKLTK